MGEKRRRVEEGGVGERGGEWRRKYVRWERRVEEGVCG